MAIKLDNFRYRQVGNRFHVIADFVRALIAAGICPWFLGNKEYAAIGRLAEIDDWGQVNS